MSSASYQLMGCTLTARLNCSGNAYSDIPSSQQRYKCNERPDCHFPPDINYAEAGKKVLFFVMRRPNWLRVFSLLILRRSDQVRVERQERRQLWRVDWQAKDFDRHCSECMDKLWVLSVNVLSSTNSTFVIDLLISHSLLKKRTVVAPKVKGTGTS